jgi:phosphatidylserine decarboxylase
VAFFLRRQKDSMGKPEPLPLWDRETQTFVEEFSDDLASTYETKPKRSVVGWLESQPMYDWAVSALQRSRWTVKNIEPFIKKHKIDMTEFEPVIYRSYAEFFTRKFRDGVRSFPSNPDEMGAFAEARYFGWEKVDPDQQFPIKGHSLRADLILGSEERARPYVGGPVLVARLSPVDYHRVHYPDDGTTLENERIGGRLWTVQWKALQTNDDILFVNERALNIIKTRSFGRLAFAEIGAMTVGRVVQIHRLDEPFRRGQEKAMFNFGGSAIVVFGEPGRWRPSDDLIEQTRRSVETRVKLGDTVAIATKSR